MATAKKSTDAVATTNNNSNSILTRYGALNIVVLIVLTALIVFIVVWVGLLTVHDNRHYRHVNHQLHEFNNLPPHQIIQKNCDTNIVYSMTDEQCAQHCLPPSRYISQRGVCRNTDVYFDLKLESSDPNVSPDHNNPCDSTKGVVGFLVGHQRTGTIDTHQCLSIDVGIQDDNLAEPNRICGDKTNGYGNIAESIDYMVGWPQYTQCMCNETSVLTLVPGTGTTRARGLCASRSLEPIFSLNRLIVATM